MLSAAESVKSVTVITGGCPVFRNARAGGAGNTQSGSHCVGSGAGGVIPPNRWLSVPFAPAVPWAHPT